MRRGHHLAAFSSKDAYSGSVNVGEEGALHAAEKEADAFAFFALGRSDGRNIFNWLCRRKKGVHGGEGFGQDFQNTQAANSGLQAGFLIGEQGPAQQLEAAGLRKGCEEKATMELVENRSWVVAFDLRASGFN